MRDDALDGDGSDGDEEEPLVPIDDPDDTTTDGLDGADGMDSSAIELNPRTGSTGYHHNQTIWQTARTRLTRLAVRCRRTFPKRAFAVWAVLQLSVILILTHFCWQPLVDPTTRESLLHCQPPNLPPQSPPPITPPPPPGSDSNRTAYHKPSAIALPLDVRIPDSSAGSDSGSVTVAGGAGTGVRAAILYLLAPYTADIAHLRTSLDLLECHFLSRFPNRYPVIVFVETNSAAVESDLSARVPSSLGGGVRFVNVASELAEFPAGFDPVREVPIWTKRTRWGYSAMIRFWFTRIFALPAMSEFDYYLRLDSDSRILATPTADPIVTVAATQHAAYAYRASSTDDLEVTRGLWAFVDRYLRENVTTDRAGTVWEAAPSGGGTSSSLVSADGFRIFMSADQLAHARSKLPASPDLFDTTRIPTLANNFEIAQLSFFRRADIAHFSRAVDESYGIYRARWGDSPLRWLTLQLFAGPQPLPPAALGGPPPSVYVVSGAELAYDHGLILGNVVVHVLRYGFCFVWYIWCGVLLGSWAVTAAVLASLGVWYPAALAPRWWCASVMCNRRFWLGVAVVLLLTLFAYQIAVWTYGSERVIEYLDAAVRF